VKRTLGLMSALLLIVLCSGCLFAIQEDRRGYGEYDRGGYGDRDRWARDRDRDEHREHERERGERREHGDRDRDDRR